MSSTIFVTSLNVFHRMLSECYAVSVRKIDEEEGCFPNLYFVDHDVDGNPYLTNNSDECIDLSTVDGDIEVFPHWFEFSVKGEQMTLLFLEQQMFECFRND
jgi:hypothetical protein